jgi:nitrite reductase/ring-hydroxylating ferredoxin subunit
VGHASEVPEPGNFKSTYIGQQPVVLVRDRKNALNVLLNRCRHRGATVCEHKKGKTASFVCLTTAGVMGWMVLCAACHILRVTATALTKPNSAW